MSTDAEREAFKSRTNTTPSGCVEWQGKTNGQGYGRFCFGRRVELAHRAAWRLFCGPIPPGKCLLHSCDNPKCVNTAHLSLGDRGDNARDMASKGRQWVQKNPEGRPVCPDELKARGEKHGNSKLSDADVLSIRRRASKGELGKALAVEFGCSKSLVSQVIRGSIWAHVGGPVRA